MANPLSNRDEDLETWKNSTKGRVVVQRLSALGERRHDMIGAGRMFHLTPRERRVNQELAANSDMDVFMNGTLQPVRLIEDDPDSQAVTGNPNHLNESEAEALFKTQYKVFATRLASISNPSALEYLLSLTQREEIHATVRQVERITARLSEVNPDTMGSASENGRPSEVAGRAVTPR